MRLASRLIHGIENWCMDRLIGRQCVQAGYLRNPIGHRSWEPVDRTDIADLFDVPIEMLPSYAEIARLHRSREEAEAEVTRFLRSWQPTPTATRD